MAKAVSGGAVGILRGSIGDTTYRWTPWGQVVQSKPVPPTHTTPGAIASKFAFRNAMHLWRLLKSGHPHVVSVFTRAAAAGRQTPTQDWAAAFMSTRYDQRWTWRSTLNNDYEAIVTRFSQTEGNLNVHFQPGSVKPNGGVLAIKISRYDQNAPAVVTHTATVVSGNQINIADIPATGATMWAFYPADFLGTYVETLGLPDYHNQSA